MVDQKLTALTENTAPAGSDITYIVDDPAGTPASQKITLANLLSLQPQTNLLINGNFDVWQRGTSFATFTDDTYGPDRWNLLSSTTARWTVAQDTSVPSSGGYTYSAKCTLASSTNTQFAMVYFFENKDALKLFGKTVSLSFWAKTTSSEIGNLRATILSWSSTADTITSDVVGTWAGAGTDPTWATNWTSEKAGSNLALTDSWAQYKVENIAIDTASTANVAVVIWVDDTTVSTNDDFWITGVQVNLGAEAGESLPRPYAQEFSMCQRYYQKYTEPQMVGVATSAAAGVGRLGMQIPEMRIAPTSTIGSLPLYDGNTPTTISSVSATYHSVNRVQFDVTAAADLINSAAVISYSAGSTTLVLDSEL